MHVCICMFEGECNWPIGSHELVYPDSLMKYKLFAMFLLQGKVGHSLRGASKLAS